jgi:guanylate kinase
MTGAETVDTESGNIEHRTPNGEDLILTMETEYGRSNENESEELIRIFTASIKTAHEYALKQKRSTNSD